MSKNTKIYVAGHNGMVGSAICRLLRKKGFENILVKTSKELDLRNQALVKEFISSEKPEIVIVAAAKVGGILANSQYKADFLYDNLMIETNLIHAAQSVGVEKLLFLGSSCIYPKMSPQPIKEEYLLTGALEPTNDAYAIAKITGIKLCDAYREQFNVNYISAMPTNLYGPNDNYDLKNSHVLPAMLRKFHEAKLEGKDFVTLWGDGSPKREFLHVDDLAEACYFLLENYNEPGPINVGTGKDLSIKELALMIKDIVDFNGEIKWDTSKPNGTPRKLLDISKIEELGWSPKIGLKEGIEKVYKEKFL
ncbi:GDP-L-fucose synthase [Ornithobacterium rhinotracheale]|uniref:GDP-L-fucose synthase family protein n=1 Tax=Ornithobacterium rhinotracheale TaxID=28251 RepID=UPI00162693D7|nr:GDP-L-fucose synthase [Ornithobacterium rhinotracheale]MRI62410.1 GDP-L-fucose synthase [Ornithobacterium rhinotracheale]